MFMFTECGYHSWECSASARIKDVLCQKCNYGQAHWDEDHITLSIIESLSNIGSKIQWYKSDIVTEWKGYKQKGKQEQRSGDIGILVKISTENGADIEGVAYYEAKKIDWQWCHTNPTSKKSDKLTNRYKSVNNTQITNLLSYANIIDILLYHPGATVAFPLELFDFALNGEVEYPSEYFMGLKLSSALALNLKGIKLDFDSQSVSEFKNIASKSNMTLIIANSGFGDANLAHAYNDDSFFENIKKEREEIFFRRNPSAKKDNKL
ncbi:hypothetical protein HMPREF3203_02068 [Proteus mirabilis]|nr:hypothetical protein HMPREF3203_02068 [Proteus mirabilis]